MDELGTIDSLRAEVASLRVITQRLLAHIVFKSNSAESMLSQELAAACADLCEVALTDAYDNPSETLRNQALHYLYQMYTCQRFHAGGVQN